MVHWVVKVGEKIRGYCAKDLLYTSGFIFGGTSRNLPAQTPENTIVHKISSFAKDHKKKLIIGAFGVGGAGTAGLIYYFCKKQKSGKINSWAIQISMISFLRAVQF